MYISSLSRSLCLALDDFYKDLSYIYCSSLTGEGMDELREKFSQLREEYFDVYYKDLMHNLEKLKLEKEKKVESEKEKLNKDLDQVKLN